MINRVLIVDDDATERDGIEFLLARLGADCEIVKACNGADALERYDREHFDIVITDIKMPLMNGIELCRNIRQRSAETVLVVLSAYGDFEYTQKAIQLRVDDYLLKPISVEEFNNVMGNALSLAQRGRRAAAAAPETGISEYRQECLHTEADSRIVYEVMRCVEEHYMENIGLEWAAAQVELSPGYLSGFFKRAIGKSFTQYLIGVRMEKARELLIQTNMRVADVGTAVGYTNASYFCLQFRKFYGATPNQIRQRGE